MDRRMGETAGTLGTVHMSASAKRIAPLGTGNNWGSHKERLQRAFPAIDIDGKQAEALIYCAVPFLISRRSAAMANAV